ncbi:hypothetical protein C3L33_03464, partial [Rhododendron williamsianum]
MASNLIKTLRARSSNLASNSRSLSGGTQVITSHTAKWMQVSPRALIFKHLRTYDMSKKSPMAELINEVPPIKVEGRIVACEGVCQCLNSRHAMELTTVYYLADNNPSLGHPIEFICLDLDPPAVCKYCGLRTFSSGPWPSPPLGVHR